MRRAILCAAVALGLSGAASAQTYECTMTNKGGGGFVGEKIFIFLDRQKKSAYALDWAIYQVYKNPVPVETQQRNADLWRFRWSVKGVPVSNEGTGSVSYTVSMNTKTGRINVNGYLAGFDNVISGNGTCRIRK